MGEAEQARALAHYLWPPLWIGGAPAGLEQSNVASNPSELGDFVAGRTLTGGTKVRAFRDGMLAFSLGPDEPTYDEYFNWLNRLIRLMNAHLACLRAAAGPGPAQFSVVTPWTTLQVDFESGRFKAASGYEAGLMLDLHNAREGSRGGWDWRFSRGPLIAVPAEWLEQSLGLLDALLQRRNSDAALLGAELIARAHAAVMDQDTSGGLTNAWTAIEGSIGALLSHYLDVQNEARPKGAADDKREFVNAKRRKFFESSDVTARHGAEFLSLADQLPFDLYRDVIRCSDARNRWLHKREIPSAEVAGVAVRAARDIFTLAEGVSLKYPEP